MKRFYLCNKGNSIAIWILFSCWWPSLSQIFCLPKWFSDHSHNQFLIHLKMFQTLPRLEICVLHSGCVLICLVTKSYLFSFFFILFSLNSNIAIEFAHFNMFSLAIHFQVMYSQLKFSRYSARHGSGYKCNVYVLVSTIIRINCKCANTNSWNK